ncbi:MAG: hypothetical protein HZY75_05095 [Nocardioidaceae bacterium]|nr:MAG: hypothetical protein HZY75_05095 [Nocardioidaceae bacterium]
MAAEYPQMAGTAGLAMLDEIEPVKKVLDRLLAGLIPIRATACNYVVTTIDGQEYVVRSGTANELSAPVRQLEIVGVTEHVGYWKDIRRVLFSSGQFKLLCRVARPGLHETWTPVKVAHLFGDVAPSLVEQIDTLSRAGTTGLDGLASGQSHLALVRALAAYADQIASMTNQSLQPSAAVELIEIAARAVDEASPSVQRQAFAAVRELIVAENSRQGADPEQDLDARRIARERAGLPVLPGGSVVAPGDSLPEHVADAPADMDVAKLIDVEVVAIYW